MDFYSPNRPKTPRMQLSDKHKPTIIVVRPKRALSNAACTIASDSLSRALVASSSSKIFGLRISALETRI
jgi:hypothetical protein